MFAFLAVGQRTADRKWRFVQAVGQFLNFPHVQQFLVAVQSIPHRAMRFAHLLTLFLLYITQGSVCALWCTVPTVLTNGKRNRVCVGLSSGIVKPESLQAWRFHTYRYFFGGNLQGANVTGADPKKRKYY